MIEGTNVLSVEIHFKCIDIIYDFLLSLLP